MFISHKLQRIFQVAAWLLVLAIVVLSLDPPVSRPITGAGHDFEHLFGYSGDGGQAFHLKADSDSGRSRTAFR
jgi:hypothetical protein